MSRTLYLVDCVSLMAMKIVQTLAQLGEHNEVVYIRSNFKPLYHIYCYLYGSENRFTPIEKIRQVMNCSHINVCVYLFQMIDSNIGPQDEISADSLDKNRQINQVNTKIFPLLP